MPLTQRNPSSPAGCRRPMERVVQAVAAALLAGGLATAASDGAAQTSAPLVTPQATPTTLQAALPELPRGLLFRTERPGVFLQAPALYTDVDITVSGLVSRVAVRQRFTNPTDVWVEGIYVFPLPEEAAVDRMVLEVGERRVVGVIKEKEEAERIYRDAVDRGQRASLLASQRPNIFTTSVANVGPGETVVVAFEYQGAVDLETDADGATTYTLRFPMVVAPRYIPGAPEGSLPPNSLPQNSLRVPDADEITPPVLDPATGRINPVAVRVVLNPGFAVEKVTSPSHAIGITRPDARSAVIAPAKGPVPADRDFVLRWTAAPAAAPRSAVFAQEVGGDAHLLVMVTPPAGAPEAAPLPRDLVFVIDTSGSMHGESMDQARDALLLALDGLGPDDRFNVISFSDETSSLFAKAMPADPRALASGRRFVAGLEAEGGTEMLPALALALSRQPEASRLRQVVFLTDGAVGNEHELFEQIAAQLGGNRVFTVGIGAAPNGYFMRKAAEVGRGSFTTISDVAEVRAAMTRLLARLARPELTDLTVTLPDGLTAGAEIYPQPLPDLYRGEPVSFAVRLPDTGLTDLAGALEIGGSRAGASWSERVGLAGLEPADGVAAVWARAKIAAIQEGAFRGRPPDAIRREAVTVALAHGLVSQYTSLVAVDAEIARPEARQLVSARMAVNLPKGMDMAHVFGPSPRQSREDTGPAPALIEVRLDDAALQVLTGETVGLPMGATPATQRLLTGLATVLLGLALLLTMRRTLRRRLS